MKQAPHRCSPSSGTGSTRGSRARKRCWSRATWPESRRWQDARETPWHMVDLLNIRPCRVMLMASERLEDGVGKPNKTAAEIAGTAKRAALRLVREHGLVPDDVIIDVSISALIADTAGMNREALAAIGLIGSDPELGGKPLSGGPSNNAQQLP